MNMGSPMYGRSISADVIREFWTKIKYCLATNTPTTSVALVQQLQKSLGWAVDETELKLRQALEAGVLIKKVDPNSRQECFFIPEDAPDPQPEHDWYCFECHGEGSVSPCKSCFRVYHPMCLVALNIQEKPNGFLCPACIAAQKPPVADRQAVFKEMDAIIGWVISQAGHAFDTLPDDAADMTEEQCQWIVARHMDLTNLRTRANRCQYITTRQFGVDFELLLHDVILVFGEDSENGRLIRQIWKEVKAEIECFENGQTGPISGRSDYVEPKVKATKRRITDEHLDGKKRKKSELGLDSMADSVSSSRSVVSKDPGGRPSLAAFFDKSGSACGCDVKYKQLIAELQSYWLSEFKLDREKSLGALSDRMQREFLVEQEKLRGEMLGQFKQELEATKKDLDQRYAQQLKQEIQKIMEKHKKQISETKKKQWCWQCEAEAIYHCCWNTAYCSVECQQTHWTQHRKFCRRKKQQQQQN